MKTSNYIFFIISCIFISCNSDISTYNINVDNDQRFILVDFSKSSIQKRLWVIENNKVLLHTYVSHGRKSGELFAKKFSNIIGSNMSCLGKFKTGEAYTGKHGLSMKIYGLDETNSNAHKRGIVFHASKYSTFKHILRYGKLGRSLGCFSTSPEDNDLIIKLATEKGSIPLYVVN
tara:strand:+ start:547 stop:1071 length:525 start_codon:yes stop_codon:yes gene_type:complete